MWWRLSVSLNCTNYTKSLVRTYLKLELCFNNKTIHSKPSKYFSLVKIENQMRFAARIRVILSLMHLNYIVILII